MDVLLEDCLLKALAVHRTEYRTREEKHEPGEDEHGDVASKPIVVFCEPRERLLRCGIHRGNALRETRRGDERRQVAGVLKQYVAA